jgi:hypothetical protein
MIFVRKQLSQAVLKEHSLHRQGLDRLRQLQSLAVLAAGPQTFL